MVVDWKRDWYSNWPGKRFDVVLWQYYVFSNVNELKLDPVHKNV